MAATTILMMVLGGGVVLDAAGVSRCGARAGLEIEERIPEINEKDKKNKKLKWAPLDQS